MSTISSVSSNTSNLSGNSGGVTTATTAGDSTTADSGPVNTNTLAASNNTIELSTRAQKIQKLNEEFFSAGPQSVKITATFIERLQEYGFLSAEEATKLSPTPLSAEEQSADTLGELSIFIDDFTAQLQEKFPDSSLIAVLQEAQSAINNFDGSNPPGTATDIKTIIAELAQYASSEEVKSLSGDDQWSLQQLKIALLVADKLGQEDNRSEQINRYLSILNQSV